MSDNFFISTKRTLYKWWCVVYKPAYQLFHHGYWPEEKNPYMRYPSPNVPNTPVNDSSMQLAQVMAAQILETNKQNQHSVDDIIRSVEVYQPVTEKPTPQVATPLQDTTTTNSSPVSEAADVSNSEIPANVDDDVLARANAIMERLNKEAADDAAKKQKEIDKAKAFASEQERLATIMKANSVDIEEFIEEGRSMQAHAEDSVEKNEFNL